MSKKECDFECEGPDCNCENFSMRTVDKNKALTFYVSCVFLLVGVSVFIVLASIIDNKIWDLVLIFVTIVDFIIIFLIISNLPDEYNTTCTEHKVYYRDIGLPRIKRKYVFAIDVLIVAIPLMLFTWDITHTIVAINSGVGADDEVWFMYFVYSWGWTLRAQGILDFFLALVGFLLLFLEAVVWFWKRGGDLCSAYFSDIPFMGLDEMERRVRTLEGDYWEESFEKQDKKWEKTKNKWKGKFNPSYEENK